MRTLTCWSYDLYPCNTNCPSLLQSIAFSVLVCLSGFTKNLLQPGPNYFSFSVQINDFRCKSLAVFCFQFSNLWRKNAWVVCTLYEKSLCIHSTINTSERYPLQTTLSVEYFMTHFASSSQTPLTRPTAWPCHLAWYISYETTLKFLTKIHATTWFLVSHFSTISPVIFCLTFITSLTNGADPLEFKLACANPIIRQLRPLDCDFVAAICFYFSNVIICDYKIFSFFFGLM